jgi:regulator of protease activity HflC (stomatin/prohibitin superfamily)
MGTLIVMAAIAIFVIIIIANTAVVVPQQNAYVVERLGRFRAILEPGFHILIPFFDVIRNKVLLKEIAIDIPEQICITRDNVQVGVDGILYFKVMNPERATYGGNGGLPLPLVPRRVVLRCRRADDLRRSAAGAIAHEATQGDALGNGLRHLARQREPPVRRLDPSGRSAIPRRNFREQLRDSQPSPRLAE